MSTTNSSPPATKKKTHHSEKRSKPHDSDKKKHHKPHHRPKKKDEGDGRMTNEQPRSSPATTATAPTTTHPTETTPKPPDSATTDMTKNQIPWEAWLTRSLTALQHPHPTQMTPCLLAVKDKKQREKNNNCLQELVIWLEDRIVRQWDIPAREGLRTSFWSSIQNYLKDLDCPDAYYCFDDKNSDGTPSIPDGAGAGAGAGASAGAGEKLSVEDSTASSCPWRNDSVKRVKVVYWLIACAISEAYADKKDEIKNEQESAFSSSYPSGTDTEKGVVNPEKGVGEGASSFTLDDFPLGFTTNDDEVDRIVKALRMRYILELRRVQDRVNEGITEMQRVTVQHQGGRRR